MTELHVIFSCFPPSLSSVVPHQRQLSMHPHYSTHPNRRQHHHHPPPPAVTVCSATVVVHPGSVVVTVIYTVVASGLIGTMVMPPRAALVVALGGGASGAVGAAWDASGGRPLDGGEGWYWGGAGMLISGLEEEGCGWIAIVVEDASCGGDVYGDAEEGGWLLGCVGCALDDEGCALESGGVSLGSGYAKPDDEGACVSITRVCCGRLDLPVGVVLGVNVICVVAVSELASYVRVRLPQTAGELFGPRSLGACDLEPYPLADDRDALLDAITELPEGAAELAGALEADVTLLLPLD